MCYIHLFALSKFNFLFYWGWGLPRADAAARKYAACCAVPLAWGRECAADLNSSFLAATFRCCKIIAFSSSVRVFSGFLTPAGFFKLAIYATCFFNLSKKSVADSSGRLWIARDDAAM